MKCLFPDCKNQVSVRGLCFKHYRSAQRYVKEGRTSWEKLEKERKALPASKIKCSVRDWILSNDNAKTIS